MLMANGALPIIFTIILVHRISYISPVRPEIKKQLRMNIDRRDKDPGTLSETGMIILCFLLLAMAGYNFHSFRLTSSIFCSNTYKVTISWIQIPHAVKAGG
jgi:hypothetical protein